MVFNTSLICLKNCEIFDQILHFQMCISHKCLDCERVGPFFKLSLCIPYKKIECEFA
jgi:hypothetical protein